MTAKYRDLHSRLTTVLTNIIEDPNTMSQQLIDDIYHQVLKLIQPAISTKKTGQKRKRGPTHKRKLKRYHYARTQDLYTKNPALLGKHIRNGTNWIDDQAPNAPNQEIVQTFYNELWGTTANICIPFDKDPNRKQLELGDALQAITTREINERIKRLRKSTAPKPDGIEQKHIVEQDMKEVLRVLFYIIMVSKLQPCD
jgi:hypothetical protein